MGTLRAYAPFAGLFHDFRAPRSEEHDDPYARFFAPRRDDRPDSQQRDVRVHGARRGRPRRRKPAQDEGAAVLRGGEALGSAAGVPRSAAGVPGSAAGVPGSAAGVPGGAGGRPGGDVPGLPGDVPGGAASMRGGAADADSGPLQDYAWMRRSTPRGSGIRFVLALLTVIGLVAGGGVVLGYQMYRDHPAAAFNPATQHYGVARSSAPARTPARTLPPLEPGSSTVTVAPALAGVPQARPIVSFLTSYFRAVNAHDYVAYRRLFDPGMQAVITAARFGAGYGTTVDSGARLAGITATADGRAAANVLFTSHQAPSEGPGRTTCTNWSLTLFLEQAGNGYLITAPPPGYRPLYQAC